MLSGTYFLLVAGLIVLVKCDQQFENPALCSHPDEPTLGRIRLEGRNPGDRVYYECAEGYMLHGESSHECTNRGEWSGSTPVCSTQSTSQHLQGQTTLLAVILMIVYSYVAMD